MIDNDVFMDIIVIIINIITIWRFLHIFTISRLVIWMDWNISSPTSQRSMWRPWPISWQAAIPREFCLEGLFFGKCQRFLDFLVFRPEALLICIWCIICRHGMWVYTYIYYYISFLSGKLSNDFTSPSTRFLEIFGHFGTVPQGDLPTHPDLHRWELRGVCFKGRFQVPPVFEAKSWPVHNENNENNNNNNNNNSNNNSWPTPILRPRKVKGTLYIELLRVPSPHWRTCLGWAWSRWWWWVMTTNWPTVASIYLFRGNQ